MKSTKAKTINGRPTSVSELSIPEINLEKNSEGEEPKGFLSRLVSACNKANLVLAGMYTGVTCYGVPHEEHSYNDEAQGGSGTDGSDVAG